jgi:hypothetical protein
LFYLADWRYRHAGLMALSATGEGCHKEMSVILDDLVNGILVFLKDSVKKKIFVEILFSIVMII